MNIITGYRGEPHITAQEDRDINIGVVGNSLNDLYVLDVGQKLEADIVSANEIRIRDGIMVMQGCAASIDYGAYDSLEISNGALGMQRIDIIAAQYEKDNDTSVENVSLVVVEGTPDAADPQPPALTGGDLQGGDTLIQMPLYYVNLDGVSIDSIDAQFKMATNLDCCTLSPATQAKWNDIAGGASNDEIMDYVADVFNATTPLLKVASQATGNFTIAASSEFARSMTASPPTGYKLLGVVGFNSNHNQSVWFGAVTSSGSTITLSGRNVGTSAQTTNITLRLLYGLSAAF